jgi:4-hydroxybenzoate polyprenyltransferase
VRWPNLVFIAVAQLLFSYCILQPIFQQGGLKPHVHGLYFVLLMISSVFIAAAGYIINDYFDLNIDLVNKPDKMVVDKVINRRWVLVWHWILSFIGIGLGFFIDRMTGVMLLGFANMACVMMLFIYSISLKKKLLSGNVLISLLTAWVILVITWCESRYFLNAIRQYETVDVGKLTRLTFLYAGFAFVISLVREVIKDMQDIEGDRRYGCKTMPIVWGLNVSKVFVAVWLFVLIASLAIVQFYVLQFKWWISAVYTIVFVILPLLIVLKKLMKAQGSDDFKKLSDLVKLAMFTGIISMIFFKIYA